MSSRGFQLRQFVLVTALLLCNVLFNHAMAQNRNPETRPRVVANHSEEQAPTTAPETDLRAQASDADAEAKRLHKDGVKYGRAGLLKQAVQLFERAVKVKPDYADAYYSLGHAYFDLGQHEEAIKALQQAIDLNPRDKEARQLLKRANLMSPSESVPEQAVATKPELQEPAGLQVALKTTPVTNATPAVTEPAIETDLTRVYRVGPGDVLDVQLSGASAQPTLITVSPAGLLQHTALKEPLPVAGLTVEQISAGLEEKLSGPSANDRLKVSVGVHDYVSHTLLVSGLVKEPGAKIIKREAIPLYVVVADAQPLAEAGRASVVRHLSNETFVADLANAGEMNLLVRPGDVITLQASPTLFFYVAGKVEAPGEKQFRPGMTLTQAIIATGGLSEGAKEALVSRDDGKGFLVVSRYKLKDINSGKKPDPPLQAGDRITIMD